MKSSLNLFKLVQSNINKYSKFMITHSKIKEKLQLLHKKDKKGNKMKY